jgi:hypothetical protein
VLFGKVGLRCENLVFQKLLLGLLALLHLLRCGYGHRCGWGDQRRRNWGTHLTQKQVENVGWQVDWLVRRDSASDGHFDGRVQKCGLSVLRQRVDSRLNYHLLAQGKDSIANLAEHGDRNLSRAQHNRPGRHRCHRGEFVPGFDWGRARDR